MDSSGRTKQTQNIRFWEILLQWYEDHFEGEGVVHWGEKWEAVLEEACEVSKRGETWRRSEADHEGYHRWWKETKAKLQVCRSGHSTSGEHWNVVEPIDDEEFFPVVQPNRYEAAVENSPQLRAVEVTPVV